MGQRGFWLAAALLLGCDDGDEGSPGCVPGASAACACENGATGAQVCQADYTFGACVCAPEADGRVGADEGVRDAMPVDGAFDAARDATPLDAVVVDATRDAAVDAAPDAAPPHRYIAGWTDNVSSNWADLPAAQGNTSLEAGIAHCRFLGGDHPCDYTEMRAAEAQGEFAVVPQGTTAWVQRTTPELVNGMVSEPGLGGNCVNWTFVGNHLADGEYAVFGSGGSVSYFLDHDTFYDGIDQTHTIPGDLQCGVVNRTLFCCNALPD